MSGERILIVEDNDQLAQIYARALALNGYDVEWEPSGAAAIASLGRRRPDLVLIDLALPDTNGVAVAQNMRALGLRCPFIAISGAADLLDHKDILQDGDFVRLVAKPMTLARLVSTVAQYLEPT